MATSICSTAAAVQERYLYDPYGNVTYMNAVSETLTGWKNDEASGVPLTQVFNIVNESTRQPVENPALRALKETGLHTLVVSGGVGANRALRTRLVAAVAGRGAQVYFPRLEFCTDNAAMIAIAGLMRFKHGAPRSLAVSARARWPLETLDALSGAA